MDADDPTPPTNTAIFGGCVSRDTLAFAGDKEYPLSRYIARHSLLSAGTDASLNFPEFEVSSKFQQRIIEFDIRGALIKDVSELGAVDVLLWDLNVERSGCWQFPDGTIVTNSPDLRRVPELKQALSNARKIDFGSEEHLLRWQGAASLFVDALHVFGLKAHTLVLAPEWALTDTDGEPTRKVGTLHPQDATEAFAPYINHLEALGLTVARFGGLVSDLNHRWGRAPFHYTPDAYEMFRNRIDEFVRERRAE
ncbi:DUF6270 domain-containing protein [Corynebacterium halotolerans]|uniref:DUF6270 domain-containing protein n=1 Tax=Corynebacterium halotolerans TaxID=225326 RepID=UPI00047AA20F|nr:DUF6270 domain-containing protein [Corynebacterium halotolerans]